MENNIISVEQTIQNIKEGLSQRGASSKDENIVMRAMLNDPNFKADIYGKDGVIGQICPHDEATKFTASVVSKTASIPQAEAELLAEKHKYTKSEAQCLVNISKEFTYGYLQTDRKLPLGGREDSNISLLLKEVPETVNTYPKKDENGNYTVPGKVTTPAHKSIKVSSPCPVWLKK